MAQYVVGVRYQGDVGRVMLGAVWSKSSPPPPVRRSGGERHADPVAQRCWNCALSTTGTTTAWHGMPSEDGGSGCSKPTPALLRIDDVHGNSVTLSPL